MVRMLTAAAVGALLAGGASASTAPTPCQQLNGTTLPLDGVASQVSLSAVDVPGFTQDGITLPNFCYVSLLVSSNANPAQSQIQIAIGMPEGGAWNGRFVGTGNGGFAGSISVDSIALYVAQGYATANTDLGTGILFACNSRYCGSAEGALAANGSAKLGGLYGDPAALRDFGFGAIHLMTLAGKQLVLAYYGQAPSYNYFHGCSTGGQNALMEAQRYPTDYNGIVAGSPAYDRTHLHVAGAAFFEGTHLAGSTTGSITQAAFSLAHAGVLAACAGKDGGLASDDFLMKPASCQFDATALQCTGAVGEVPCTDPNATSCTCLTAIQSLGFNKLWVGAQDSLGRILYPGYERGAEDPGTAPAGGPPDQEHVTEPLFDSLDYWAFGKYFTWNSLFANTDGLQGLLAGRIAALDKAPAGGADFATVLNANNANITPFAAAGGKLVMYAGYEDPLIPAASALDYANAVAKDDAVNYGNYLRLFLAPGMWHCSGGPGANAFGNLGTPLAPVLGDPADDIFAAMRNWVENGVAPSTILATKYTDDTVANGVAFTRPLCAYPANAKYRGAGDPTNAASWECVAGDAVRNQAFAPLYGPH